MAIPAGYGTSRYPDLLVEDGKDGRVWLLNRDDLGGVGQGKSRGQRRARRDRAVQRGVGPPGVLRRQPGLRLLRHQSGPDGCLRARCSSDGVPRLSLAGQTVVPGVFGYRSGSPSVTSTGRSPGTGLVWVVYSTGPSGAYGTLNAYDAVPVHGVLKLVRSWPIGTVSQFSNVTTNDGRVYVGNKLGQVLCFGTISATAAVADWCCFSSVRLGAGRPHSDGERGSHRYPDRHGQGLSPLRSVRDRQRRADAPGAVEARSASRRSGRLSPDQGRRRLGLSLCGDRGRNGPGRDVRRSARRSRPGRLGVRPCRSVRSRPANHRRLSRCRSPMPGPDRRRSPRC